jgi:hypothetical protein
MLPTNLSTKSICGIRVTRARLRWRLKVIGWTHFFRSEDQAACEAFEECLRLRQASGDQHLVIRAMVGLAQVLVVGED